MLLAIVVIIITLFILVVSHEFGHFITAKFSDVKVLEFGFGIPPRAWGKKFGETIVSLNWLPIGGFVKLLGEDETDHKTLDDKRSFAVKPVGNRIAIVAAGVAMNLILAVFLFYVVIISQGYQEQIPLIIPHQFAGVSQQNDLSILVDEMAPSSPADKAGMKVGDSVVAFDGQPLQNTNQFISLTKEHLGEKVTLTLEDEQGQKRQVEVVPRANPPKNEGAIGVALATVGTANLTYTTLGQKVFSGFIHTYNITVYSMEVLGKFIGAAFQTHNLAPVSDTVAGPVGITNMTKTILEVRAPLIPYLNFMALLSLNLAIVNILPFPALDGGRLVFLLWELISRRKVKPEFEKWVHTVGMVILIALIILITFSDISKLFH